jgi:uridine kinase
MRTIQISIEDSSPCKLPQNTPVWEALKQFSGSEDQSVMAAIVNNRARDLNYPLQEDSKLQPIPFSSLEGIRIYQRTCIFVLVRALRDCAPLARARVVHPIPNGLYIEFDGLERLDPAFIRDLRTAMTRLVQAELPIARRKITLEKAIEFFQSHGEHAKVRLLQNHKASSVTLYDLDGLQTFFFGFLAPKTSYAKHFSLSQYGRGLLLKIPSRHQPNTVSESTHQIRHALGMIEETVRWRKIVEIEDLGSLNEAIRKGRVIDSVQLSEAAHEKRLTKLADLITNQVKAKIIFLSGPSASGKTTFAKRLALQLRINGVFPIPISMDDYFLDRDKTPRQPNGDFDFESPHALDIARFERNLQDLLAERSTTLPRYDFKTGTSIPLGRTINPHPQSVFVVEGIHALNPIFSKNVNPGSSFKIYVSPVVEITLDDQNRIPATDARMLRRMVRDSQFRNYSASQTIMRWPAVREGESKHIFPHQDEADFFFNTALLYELAAIKKLADPLLANVRSHEEAYPEAMRLRKFLSFILDMPHDAVPNDSILREFIGGSCFQ